MDKTLVYFGSIGMDIVKSKAPLNHAHLYMSESCSRRWFVYTDIKST